MAVGLFMLVVLLSFFWAWRTVILKLSSFLVFTVSTDVVEIGNGQNSKSTAHLLHKGSDPLSKAS